MRLIKPVLFERAFLYELIEIQDHLGHKLNPKHLLSNSWFVNVISSETNQ